MKRAPVQLLLNHLVKPVENAVKQCHQSWSLNHESGSNFFPPPKCYSIDMLLDVAKYKLSKENKANSTSLTENIPQVHFIPTYQ